MFKGDCLSTDFCGILATSVDPDKVFLSNSFGNTIYLLDKNKKLIPKYYFDCGQEGLPDNPDEICKTFARGLEKFSICFLTKKLFELENNSIFLSYMKKNRRKFIFLNQIDENELENFMLKEEFLKRIFEEPVGAYQNNLICPISGYSINRVLQGGEEKLFDLNTELGVNQKKILKFDERDGNILIGFFEIL